MTCAEARRQLSAPDAARAAEIDAHLEDCAPCRGESESLKEVDRRLMRLGEVRRGVARAAYSRDPGLGRAASSPGGSAGAAPMPRSLPMSLSGLGKKAHLESAVSPSGSRARPPARPDSRGSRSVRERPLPRAARASLLFFALVVAIVLPAFLWLMFRIRH